MEHTWCRLKIVFFWMWVSCHLSFTFQQTSNSTDDISRGYVVWNPSCRIPHTDPYDDSIKEYIKFDKKQRKCSYLDPLTTVVFNSTSQKHTLKVNSNVVQKYWSTISSLTCCYSIISRSSYEENGYEIDDNKYNMSAAVCFKNQIDLPADAEKIFVYCTSRTKKVYKNIYFTPTNKKPKPATTGDNKKKYSLLLFAIGSMSRMNFIRSFPKTRKYIEERDWLPLEGYTKVGENSFSNAIPILTGMTAEQLIKVCSPHKQHKLDNCPFIWKNFSKNGYLTSFTEDGTGPGILSWNQYGFLNNPTDYYSQPLLNAAEDLLRKKGDSEAGDDFCLGQYTQIEYLFQFNRAFVQRFHDRPYFNLFWANSLTHDSMKIIVSMDNLVRTFLEDIEPYLNSTVLVFFSDHGTRQGDISKTFLGWLEDRMPFIYFFIPPSLKANHQSWYRTLRENKNKLTSPFDLHATLQTFLNDRIRYSMAGCAKCSSLFSSIPYKRSCQDAGIAAPWCPCWTTNDSNSISDPPATAPAHEAISIINQFLQKKENQLKRGYKCASLSLSKVKKVQRENVNVTSKNTIVFETKPKKVNFEITVPEGIVKVENIEEIRRTTKGANPNTCIKKNDPVLKKFCSCIKK